MDSFLLLSYPEVTKTRLFYLTDFYLNFRAQFSSVQLLSHVWLFVTSWIAARQASLSITNSQSSLKLMSIESVMPSSHLNCLCFVFYFFVMIKDKYLSFIISNILHLEDGCLCKTVNNITHQFRSVQFSSFQLLSCVQLFVTLWTEARQASLSITNSQSLLKLMFIESVMPTISSSVVPFSSCLQSFQHQGHFKWVSSLHQVAKVLEFQLQHQSFHWIFRTDFL